MEGHTGPLVNEQKQLHPAKVSINISRPAQHSTSQCNATNILLKLSRPSLPLGNWLLTRILHEKPLSVYKILISCPSVSCLIMLFSDCAFFPKIVSFKDKMTPFLYWMWLLYIYGKHSWINNSDENDSNIIQMTGEIGSLLKIAFIYLASYS